MAITERENQRSSLAHEAGALAAAAAEYDAPDCLRRDIALLIERMVFVCPRCRQAWLVSGFERSERHICKECGHASAV
ncbi:MAG: hypothetical protein ACRD68_01850 [Pyrinomonadaceae bacterium]